MPTTSIGTETSIRECLDIKVNGDFSTELKRIDRGLRDDGKQWLELSEETSNERVKIHYFGLVGGTERAREKLRRYYPEIDFNERIEKIVRTYKPSDFQSPIRVVDTLGNDKWDQLATEYISDGQKNGKWVLLNRSDIEFEYSGMIPKGLLKKTENGCYMLTPLALEMILLRHAK